MGESSGGDHSLAGAHGQCRPCPIHHQPWTAHEV